MTPDTSVAPSSRRSRLRRSVFAAATLITLVALFYAEENWRGKRAWEDYKRARIAAGEAFDKSVLEQPSVPDDQNFYKTPLLEEMGYKDLKSPTNVAKASWLWGDARAIGNLAEGKRTKISVYSDSLRHRSEYSAPPTPLDPAADVVRLFNQAPEVAELRRASLRPYSQCNSVTSPFADPVPNFLAIRGFVQGFALLAQAELDSGDPEAAANDLHVVMQFADAVRGNPTLVSAMIRVAVLGLYTQAFWDGWADRRWTDKQYETFQKSFLSLSPFVDYERGFQGERVGVRILLSGDGADDAVMKAPLRPPFGLFDRIVGLFIKAIPKGWYYQNLVVYHRNMEATSAGLDVPGKRYNPIAGDQAEKRLEALRTARGPFSLLSRVAMPNFVKARITCARSQAFANEAAIVCALERFRHAEGHYPSALSELSPKFMATVPADVIGDQPLRYRLIDKGFVLYSVGMDGKDDGGVSQKDLAASDAGDWVWMNPVD